MQIHNYQWRKVMTPKKPRARDEDGKFVSAKAIVGELGVSDTQNRTNQKWSKLKMVVQ